MSTAASSASTDKLSTTRPRKPFTSPGTSRQYDAVPAGAGPAGIVALSAAKIQKRGIAARRGGIVGERSLVRESRKIVRTAGLGAGAGQTGAAKWLDAHDRADHVAIDVSIADRRLREHLAPERLQSSLHAQRQTIVAGTNCLQHFACFGGSIAHHVQYRPEFLTLELRRIFKLDEMRSEETAVRMLFTQLAHLHDARLVAHPFDMLQQPFRRSRVDHRPDVGLELGGIADDEFVHGAGDHLQDLVCNLLLQKQ